MHALLRWKNWLCNGLPIARRQVHERLQLKSVWSVLYTVKMHPFHIQRVKPLTEDDYSVKFVRWMVKVITHTNPQFTATVLFSDKASFTRESILNTQNARMWSMQNPHASVPGKPQQRFSVNVWDGILYDYLLAPCLLPDRLNGASYHVLQQHVLPELLQSLQATFWQNMWCPIISHVRCTTTSVSHIQGGGLDAYASMIGRGDPCSPYVNTLDFFHWVRLK